jgi:MYND finger
MIKSYHHQDIERGIFLLKLAAKRGYVRSNYTLGLILRDSMPEEASKYMAIAAHKGYLPALQEVLPARDMKAKYGEPKATELRKYLDPVCLNRLLGRHYLQCSHLREVNTSHCWNPLCGRWAFKAQVAPNGTPLRLRRAFNFAFFRNEQGLLVAHNNASDRVIGGQPSMECSPVTNPLDLRVSRMKMCSRCCRAKYCSKLCQVYDWRSGRHKTECQFL